MARIFFMEFTTFGSAAASSWPKANLRLALCALGVTPFVVAISMSTWTKDLWRRKKQFLYNSLSLSPSRVLIAQFQSRCCLLTVVFSRSCLLGWFDLLKCHLHQSSWTSWPQCPPGCWCCCCPTCRPISCAVLGCPFPSTVEIIFNPDIGTSCLTRAAIIFALNCNTIKTHFVSSCC